MIVNVNNVALIELSHDDLTDLPTEVTYASELVEMAADYGDYVSLTSESEADLMVASNGQVILQYGDYYGRLKDWVPPTTQVDEDEDELVSATFTIVGTQEEIDEIVSYLSTRSENSREQADLTNVLSFN